MNVVPSFILPRNGKNLKIVETMKSCASDCEVKIAKDAIAVVLKYGLSLSAFDLTLRGIEITESEWRMLFRQIKRTIKDGKVRLLNKSTISISPLKTDLLIVRLSPLEKRMVAEAARLQGKKVASFVRDALMDAVGAVFDQETLKKMAEKVQGSTSGKGYVT